MPSYFRKKSSNVDMVLQDARGATVHGGQLIVDALAKDFGLWEKIQACGCMDPRKDKSRGFFPEAIVAQILFNFCSGGISLADAGRLSSLQQMDIQTRYACPRHGRGPMERGARGGGPQRATHHRPEWVRMGQRLLDAVSQREMNRLSEEMTEYIDRKLEKVEDKVLSDLDEQSTKHFRAASKAWREYRLAESSFEGDLFRDGSVHPLIRNRAYIRITQQRISDLSNLGEN